LKKISSREQLLTRWKRPKYPVSASKGYTGRELLDQDRIHAFLDEIRLQYTFIQVVLGQTRAFPHALTVTVRTKPGGCGALQPLAAAIFVLFPPVRVHVLEQLALPEEHAATDGATDFSLSRERKVAVQLHRFVVLGDKGELADLQRLQVAAAQVLQLMLILLEEEGPESVAIPSLPVLGQRLHLAQVTALQDGGRHAEGQRARDVGVQVLPQPAPGVETLPAVVTQVHPEAGLGKDGACDLRRRRGAALGHRGLRVAPLLLDGD